MMNPLIYVTFPIPFFFPLDYNIFVSCSDQDRDGRATIIAQRPIRRGEEVTYAGVSFLLRPYWQGEIDISFVLHRPPSHT